MAHRTCLHRLPALLVACTLCAVLLLGLSGARRVPTHTVQAAPDGAISLPPSTSSAAASPAAGKVDALQHLQEVMDQFHTQLDVYTDLGAAGNHFVTRASLGDAAITVQEGYTATVYRGASAMRNAFTASGTTWGGWYLHNGVLSGDAVQPQPNWGTVPDAGLDLTGATRLTFYARGERVEFFALGVGRDPTNGSALAPYPDSEAKVTTCGRLISPCYVTLSATWQPYTITLTGMVLSYVLGGFGWVTSSAENGGQSIVFYLDDIRYDLPRLDAPRFLVSYQTLPTADAFDTVHRNVAFTYDNALALLAFLAMGETGRAKQIADAFVYAQQHDRWYSDGRLRTAYQAGDLVLPPGWTPHGLTGTVRLPGWWEAGSGTWTEDPAALGSKTGDMAWVMLALLAYYEAEGGDAYLQAVEMLGNWVETNTRDTRGAGGYTGGVTGVEPNTAKLLWKSVEHNLDLSVAFLRLAALAESGEQRALWQARANHARAFVEAMWNEAEGHYWAGTLDNGLSVNPQAIPLDAQSWALLALGPNARTRRALDYAETNHAATWGSLSGFDFDSDRDQPWFEGTGQMVLAYRTVTDTAQAQTYLAELHQAQAGAPNGNGRGLVAAAQDGLTTGFGWQYYNRLHVGATAWLVSAETNTNPFWPPPTITDFAPRDGWVGSTVVISGTGLSRVTSVQIDGVDASFAVLSPFVLSATVPLGAWEGPIQVSGPHGRAISTQPFTVTTKPISYLEVRLAGGGRGQVTSDSADIVCPDRCFAFLDVGTEIQLRAEPETGHTFGGWMGSCSGRTITCTVSLDTNVSYVVTANFAAPLYLPAARR